MNCGDFEIHLQRLLDGSAELPDEHAATCPACGARVAQARRLLHGLALIAVREPPADLGSRIFVAVTRQRQQRRRLRFAGVLCAAACLLVGLFTWLARSPEAGVAKVVPINPEVAPNPAENDVRPLREHVAEAGSALAALTSRTAAEAAHESSQLWPALEGPSLAQLEIASPGGVAVNPLREAGEGVSAGLEPVAQSARRAYRLFLRELPAIDGDGGRGL